MKIKALIAHEYIESKLMFEGVFYRGLDNNLDAPTPYNYGAHELSSKSDNFSFSHWVSAMMGRTDPGFSISNNLSNLDEIISLIKLIEGL